MLGIRSYMYYMCVYIHDKQRDNKAMQYNTIQHLRHLLSEVK